MFYIMISYEKQFNTCPDLNCYLLVKVVFFFQVKEQSDSEDRKQSPGQKRHHPITFDNEHDKRPEKRSRSGDRNLKMYTPPSGKYSSRLNNNGRFSGSNSFRGGRGGYGRRDFRNNGAPFRRRNNY